MIPMTTSSSTRVKPRFLLIRFIFGSPYGGPDANWGEWVAVGGGRMMDA
jgi:hypothetical protein